MKRYLSDIPQDHVVLMVLFEEVKGCKAYDVLSSRLTHQGCDKLRTKLAYKLTCKVSLSIAMHWQGISVEHCVDA